MQILNYLAQIVPPSLTVKHYERFDMEVADFVLELMSLAGAPGLPCPDARLLAFKQRLRLPMRHGGAGLVGVDSICAAAFTGSVIACAELDTILADNIDGLERFAQPTLDLLKARLAPLGPTRINTLLRLPLTAPSDLFDHSRYVEQDSEEIMPAPKLQQLVSRGPGGGGADFAHTGRKARGL
jgi:hypothetical protein